MGRFRERLIRFMYGRNGIDAYNRFIFALYFILTVIYWIASLFIHPIASTVFSCVLFAMMIYLVFRTMSRNIVKRQVENRRYLAFSSIVKSFFKLQKNKFKDRKTHVYRKCPSCKAVLRLKKIKGNHRAVCPRCSKSFDVKV